jgi:predicted Zn-dependent peptidase
MKKHISFIFVFLSLSISAFGQIDNISSQAALVTEFDADGIKVILKRRPNSPTVAAGLFIKGGARNINDKTAGIERLTLSTAIEAGKNTPRATVRREMSRTGSSIGSGINNDFSVISLATTRPDFDRTFEIFADVTLNPVFAEEDLARNREQLLAALRETGSTPEAALANLEQRIVYAGHPYANDVSGNPTTVAAFTAADLRAYHAKIMEKSRMLFVFVGDIEPERLKSMIVAKFGKLPKGTYKDEPVPAVQFTHGTLDTVQRNLPTNYVKGTFAAPSLGSPDYHAMRVAMSLLQTLVYQEVRGNLQLSYAPDADMENLAANTANISVSTTDPNRATVAMLNQMRLLQERTLPASVIDEVSAFFLTRYYMNQETSAAQAAELARYELIGGGWRNAFEFINGVKKVTPQDLRNVSNKYMRNLRFTYIGDASGLNRSVFVPQS